MSSLAFASGLGTGRRVVEVAKTARDHYQDLYVSRELEMDLSKCDANNHHHHHHQIDHHSNLNSYHDNDSSLGKYKPLHLSSAELIREQQQSISDNLQENLSNSLESVSNYYKWINSFADKRVESWPMMSGPLPTLIAVVLYLVMANYGPRLMKSYKPLQLRWLLVAYNLYVASLNLWMALEIGYCSYKLGYRSFCQLVVVSNDPYVMRIANVVWWYYASKGFEFADTLFFVLRKKDRQLTFLHKYHHSSMFVVWWIASCFVPGGSCIVPIFVNSLVHVLMYSYYGLSALGPQIQKYLWWKRYLTIVQLVQFVIGVSIGIHLIASGCQFTRWMQYVFSAYAFSFIILFGNFYLHEYTSGRKQKAQKDQIEEEAKKQQQSDPNKVKRQ